MSSNSIVLVLFYTLFVLFNPSSSTIVDTENGQVEGTTMQTWTGQNFDAFLGITFAEPPINELRFEPPIPVNSWSGVRDASNYGRVCMQTPFVDPLPLVMSEDCLNLNVFTKNVQTVGTTPLKPVIVFLHGGGLNRLSGAQMRPNYIMDRDVVYVTINYRLGALGFLATGTEDAPGNVGMKDQILGLKWVQANIRNFGGNPDKVTLVGMSAGIATALMASALTENLFHGVISMSNAITYQFGLANHHLDAAITLGRKLNCMDSNPKELVACLKTKSAEDIVNIVVAEVNYCGISKWLPVVEADFGQERVLIEDPNQSFRYGRFQRVPVIIGITENEYASPVPQILDINNVQHWNDNFPEMLSECCFYFNGRNIETVGQTLRKAYLPFSRLERKSFNSLSALISDGIIGSGVHRFVHFVSDFTDVYYYKFTYKGRYSVFNYPHDRPYGVHHIDDLQYVVYLSTLSPLYNTSAPESLMVQRMTRIWEQFAWNGNPNNETDEYLSEMNWPKHDTVNEYYLDIGSDLVEKNGLNLERYAVWDELDTGSSSTLKLPILLILATSLVKFAF